MSKAAIAVPYLIAIVIGVIILAVMIYLIFKSSSGGEKMSAEECRSRFVEWCSLCLNSGWKDFIRLPEDLKSQCAEVMETHLGFNINQYNNCSAEDAKLDCCTVGVKNEKCP